MEDVERFHGRYAVMGADAMLAAELDVLGTDYSANGYTTREQAAELGRYLQLDERSVLLDVGSGAGWPGLYLAKTFGCSVVSLDPVATGMAISQRRAASDQLDAWPVVAFAGDLPIRPRSVDAIVHSDVMC